MTELALRSSQGLMNRLIECVPNFSEGRDVAVLDALVAVMSGVPGAWVLDRSSDADHNRAVVTLAGEPEAVAEAAIRGVGKAAELIDLKRQSGAHPRIGATDVLPFIPLQGISIEECVALARRAAREIWERYRIPVYFYEAAATRPERVNLENIRKGQFEGLREQALRDPDRSPDIGEPRLHPTAGATAVGVRKILIAYNIHLSTSDVSIAKAIAKVIRYSGGGLRHVKAIGVDLKSRGIAQVSINLTDFEETPLHRVFEMTKREAERHGCQITGSEIIGLAPQKALDQVAEYYLQLENYSPVRILENRLAEVAGASNRSLVEIKSDGSAEVVGASRLAALATARANLKAAITGMELFEQWMQLETAFGPSMLVDFRAAREKALAAARSALDTAEADLKAILAARDISLD
jgi:glutamate formiminotransferase